MNKTKRITALFLAALLLLPAWLSSCGERGVTLKLNGKKVFTTAGGIGMWQTSAEGDMTVTLINRTNNDVSLTLYSPSCDSGKITLSAAADKKTSEDVTLSASSDAVCGGVRLICANEDNTYIISESGLTAAAADGGQISVLCDLTVEESLIISVPLSLNTDGNSLSVLGSIFFSCPDSGTLSLTGDISADGFYASAPECDITVPASLVPKDRDYCIAAKSLNSIACNNAKQVTSMEQLTRLADAECYPVITQGDAIVLSGFAVTAPVALSEPCTLSAENTDFNYPITIKTTSEGTISIGDGIDPVTNISIDAPNCDVRADNITISRAAGIYIAKSFFGYTLADYTAMGGTAPSLAMYSAENSCVSDNIFWQNNSDGVLYTSVSVATAPESLKSASLSLTAPSGYSASFDKICLTDSGKVNLLSPLGCYVRVTDPLGNKGLFEVKTEVATRLPCVAITTASGEPITSKEEYSAATVSIQSEFSEEITESLTTTDVQISGRGNSTWRWSEKKPYKLKFSEKTSVLGLPAAKKWVLLANYADKSLMRNFVALETAKVLDNFDCYATQYPVDVFLNGIYAGVYTMGESVEEGKNRIEVRENALSPDCGFLLELNGDNDEASDFDMFSTSMLNDVEIVFPDASVLSQKQSAFIQNYVNVAENNISSEGKYDDYIDIDSLIDWYIMTELSFNSDSCFRRSVFLKKDSMGKLEMCQVWDFDLAYGNNINDTVYDCWACLSPTSYVSANWMYWLMGDKKFTSRLKARWNEVRESVLAAELSAVEHAYDIIEPSAVNNFSRYDILSAQVGLEPAATLGYTTYEAQKERLVSFINSRWSWIDNEMNNL